MTDPHPFYIFSGDSECEPHAGLKALPPPPPWRSFVRLGEKDNLDENEARSGGPITERELEIAKSFQVDQKNRIRDAVNAALYLRRPLLVTGRPGTGKSSIVRAVARELRLGPVLTWNITSRSTLRDGLYEYDALGRLQEIQARQALDRKEKVKVAEFVTLGPLGTAFVPAKWPKALLIDEIDKADLDLPNDLLNVLEEGRFVIPEILRDPESADTPVNTWESSYDRVSLPGGQVACRVFPFIVMTSNGEREFSAPFLRRCIRLDIEPPNEQMLGDIVRAHFVGEKLRTSLDNQVKLFVDKRGDGKLATDQLLNAIFLLERVELSEPDCKRLIELVYQELS